MRDLFRSDGDFQLHIIVGDTQHEELRASFVSARELLKQCADEMHTVVHDEAEAPQLGERIARDIAEAGA